MKAWLQQLDAARGDDALMQVARDYIASLSPEEWSSVPAACRPGRIKGIDDIAFWHGRLAEAYLAVAALPGGNETLREMLAFFAAAERRTAQIRAARVHHQA